MKTILLTGASGGIGSAIANVLAGTGNRVIRIERKDTDLSSYEEIKKLAEKMESENLKLDWIICAHGFIDAETNFESQGRENIEKTFQLNTLSIAYIAQLFLKQLNAGGGMIAISSTAGISGNRDFPIYSASKAAVNTFMQALARGHEQQSFYAICPGPTQSAMWEKIGGQAGSAQDPTAVANVVEAVISGTYRSGDIIVVRDGKTNVASRLNAS